MRTRQSPYKGSTKGAARGVMLLYRPPVPLPLSPFVCVVCPFQHGAPSPACYCWVRKEHPGGSGTSFERAPHEGGTSDSSMHEHFYRRCGQSTLKGMHQLLATCSPNGQRTKTRDLAGFPLMWSFYNAANFCCPFNSDFISHGIAETLRRRHGPLHSFSGHFQS